MGYAKVLSVGLAGVAGHLVEVEADLAPGLPAVIISGLPDTALHEARDRVRAAIVNSGQKWPNRRITLNLLPATLPKYGSAFDLAIAVAVLAGSGELPPVALDATVVLGELGLDGAVRPVRGTLPMVAAAARAGHTRVVVPAGNAAEAAVIPGVRVHAVDTLHRLVAHVRTGAPLLAPPAPAPAGTPPGPDLADVAGQPLGRRALEIAAAGGHHLALLGPPGAGKTMLAERLPSVLPELDDEAALEVTALHSIAGLLPPGGGLLRRPPFQAPHHTATVPALSQRAGSTAEPPTGGGRGLGGLTYWRGVRAGYRRVGAFSADRRCRGCQPGGGSGVARSMVCRRLRRACRPHDQATQQPTAWAMTAASSRPVPIGSDIAHRPQPAEKPRVHLGGVRRLGVEPGQVVRCLPHQGGQIDGEVAPVVLVVRDQLDLGVLARPVEQVCGADPQGFERGVALGHLRASWVGRLAGGTPARRETRHRAGGLPPSHPSGYPSVNHLGTPVRVSPIGDPHPGSPSRA